MRYKELSKEQKNQILFEEYYRDGADKDIALNASKSCDDPDKTLRDVFMYTDEMDVNI